MKKGEAFGVVSLPKAPNPAPGLKGDGEACRDEKAPVDLVGARLADGDGGLGGRPDSGDEVMESAVMAGLGDGELG